LKAISRATQYSQITPSTSSALRRHAETCTFQPWAGRSPVGGEYTSQSSISVRVQPAGTGSFATAKANASSAVTMGSS
jgi:hypothetical protein